MKIPAGSTGAPALPGTLKTKIGACADAMQDGFTRATIRIGKRPTTTERAWQTAIIREFVRNGCTDITSSDLVSDTCQAFAEKWPYGYAGKIARPGTVIVFGFKPI